MGRLPYHSPLPHPPRGLPAALAMPPDPHDHPDQPLRPPEPEAEQSLWRWLVAAGQQSGFLTVYAIDSVSGRLQACCRQRTGKEPICVEIVSV